MEDAPVLPELLLTVPPASSFKTDHAHMRSLEGPESQDSDGQLSRSWKSSELYKISKMLRLTGFAGCIIIVFCALKNLFHDCKYVGMVDPRWMAFWEYFLHLGGFSGCGVLAIPNIYCRYELGFKLHSLGLWFTLAMYMCVMGIGCYMTLVFLENPKVLPVARMSSIFLFCVVFWTFLRRKAGKIQYAIRAKKNVTDLFVALALLFSGFYFALFMAQHILPKTQEVMAKSSLQGTTKSLVTALVETCFVFFFFSIFLPLWGKVIAHCTNKCVAHRTDDPHYSMDELEDRTSLLINFFLDLTRFAYGRAIIFSVSSRWLFYALLFKDVVYQFFHFGIKYLETIQFLTIRIYHPEQILTESLFWKYGTLLMEFYVRLLGIPKNLSAAFTKEIRFRSYPETDVSVSFTFCNMRVKVTNLPVSFAGLNKNERVLQTTPDIGQDLAALPFTDQEDAIRKEAELMAQKLAKRRRSSVLQAVDFIADMVPKERIPLTKAERNAMKVVGDQIQDQIFLRYQVRASTKLFTSFAFLGVPIVARYTATRFVPHFVDPFGNSETEKRYLEAGLSFFIFDILEWLILTFYIHLRVTKNRIGKVNAYSKTVSDGLVSFWVVVMTIALGSFMFNVSLDSYNITRLAASANLGPDTTWPQIYASKAGTACV